MENAAGIRHVINIIKTYLDQKPILVLSAMGDTYYLLLEAGDAALKKSVVDIEKIADLHLKVIIEMGLGNTVLTEITSLLDELKNLLKGISLVGELTGKSKDQLLSFGGRLLVRIVAACFVSQGIKAQAVDAWDAGFVSDSNFTSAELMEESWKLIPEKLLPPVEEGILQIVPGFLAKDMNDNITSLGDGGSDLSATMIAAACEAEEVQIWKGVDGILSADPRIVRGARPVDIVSYEAASEVANFATQVLHPQAMEPCIKTGTPVLIKNFHNPEVPGTRIVQALGGKASHIQAITSQKNVTVVDIVSSRMLGQHGFLANAFSCFAKHNLSVDMIATSEVSISLTLNSVDDLTSLKNDLSRIASVRIATGKTIITIIGDIHRFPEILTRTFRVCELLGVHVQMVSQGASKLNFSFIVEDNEAAEVIKALHTVSLNPARGPVTSVDIKMKAVLIGYGRMGHLIENRLKEKGHKVIAIIDPLYASKGESVPAGVALYASLDDAMKGPKGKNLKDAHVAFDFTAQEAAPETLLFLAKEKIPTVSGTTGWYDKLPEIIPVVNDVGSALVWSSNFSQGVNLFFRIASYAAKLADPFSEYEVAGVETHHNKKADSPSGTAITLVEKVLNEMTRKKKAVYEMLDRPPKPDELHYASVRVGSVPGIHSLMFDSPADTIELTHTARNREGFAAGAVLAAEWLVGGNRVGVFTMDDILADILPAI